MSQASIMSARNAPVGHSNAAAIIVTAAAPGWAYRYDRPADVDDNDNRAFTGKIGPWPDDDYYYYDYYEYEYEYES